MNAWVSASLKSIVLIVLSEYVSEFMSRRDGGRKPDPGVCWHLPGHAGLGGPLTQIKSMAALS